MFILSTLRDGYPTARHLIRCAQTSFVFPQLTLERKGEANAYDHVSQRVSLTVDDVRFSAVYI